MSISTQHGDAGETSLPGGTRISKRLLRFKNMCLALVMTAAILAVPAWVHAESIAGKILDPQGNAIGEAKIRLFVLNGAEMRSTTSSKDGAYSFQGIPEGNYLLDWN